MQPYCTPIAVLAVHVHNISTSADSCAVLLCMFLCSTHTSARALVAMLCGVELAMRSNDELSPEINRLTKASTIMAESTSQGLSGDRSYRETSVFSPPEYQISYGHDHTLQWEPPVDSKELAIALSYHFPLQRDLESKMQAATRRFLRQERDNASQRTEQVKPTCVKQAISREHLPTTPIESSKDSGLEIKSTLAPTLQILTWDSEMKEFNPKIKRRRYDKGERVKVAANRGFACDQHRRQKMKVHKP
jgi:hypothetical protein